MQNLFENDLVITKIHFASLVSGKPQLVHQDRSFHGFAVVYGGETRFRFADGTELFCNDHTIIYFPKHADYTVHPVAFGACYCINFSLAEEIDAAPFIFSPRNMAPFEKLFKTADQHWTAKHSGYELKCRSLLYELLYDMQKEQTQGYQNRDKFAIIAPAVDYIHANYITGPIRIHALAKMCGISHEYLRQLFQRFYNTTPTAYINAMKMSYAKELLESGEYNVTTTACALGYTDIGYFSREFKKATGFPPSHFCRQPQRRGNISAD